MTFRPLELLVSFVLLMGFAMPAADAQEREWTLDASDQDAYLIFGVPESDDVGLSLWCPIGQGVVNVFIPEAMGSLPPDAKVMVFMEAAGETVTLEGSTEVNVEAGFSSVEVQFHVGHDFLIALQKSDRLKVRVEKEETVFPLYEADLAGLFALCRAV